MSHAGVRLLANWLNDPTNGLNAVAADLPRFAGDPAPPTLVGYDETRTGWVARGQIPQPQRETPAVDGITFPLWLVYTQAADFDDCIPAASDTGARLAYGTLPIVVQMIVRDVDTENAATAMMYLIRALRGSIMLFNDPANEANREALGIRLDPATSVKPAKLDAPVGDVALSSALLVTFPVIETTPLS